MGVSGLGSGRRVIALALLGLATGVGEAAVVVLVVALAAGERLDGLPLAEHIPSSARAHCSA